MIKNINTKEYWNQRFISQDWEKKSGRRQTRIFAKEQCRHFSISNNFSGIITDFGCGLGDSMPVYRKYFPNSELRGYDISNEAINKCRKTYGSFAEFFSGTARDVEYSDIIISSNVFEHLTDDTSILRILLKKCKLLYVTVPYNEILKEGTEHVNSYNENSFAEYKREAIIYSSNGMSESVISLVYNIYIKNIFRFLIGRPIKRRPKQIMFKFIGEKF